MVIARNAWLLYSRAERSTTACTVYRVPVHHFAGLNDSRLIWNQWFQESPVYWQYDTCRNSSTCRRADRGSEGGRECVLCIVVQMWTTIRLNYDGINDFLFKCIPSPKLHNYYISKFTFFIARHPPPPTAANTQYLLPPSSPLPPPGPTSSETAGPAGLLRGLLARRSQAGCGSSQRGVPHPGCRRPLHSGV